MQTDLLKHSGRYFKIAFSSIPQFHSQPLPHWANQPSGRSSCSSTFVRTKVCLPVLFVFLDSLCHRGSYRQHWRDQRGSIELLCLNGCRRRYFPRNRYCFSLMLSPLVPSCSLAPRVVECTCITTPF